MSGHTGDPEAKPKQLNTATTPPPVVTSPIKGNSSHAGAIAGGKSSPPLFILFYRPSSIGLKLGDHRCGWWGHCIHHHRDRRVLCHPAKSQEQRRRPSTGVPTPGGVCQLPEVAAGLTHVRPGHSDRGPERPAPTIREFFKFSSLVEVATAG